MSEVEARDSAEARFEVKLKQNHKMLSDEKDILPQFAVGKSKEIGSGWENCKKTENTVGFCKFRKKKNRDDQTRSSRRLVSTHYSVFVAYSQRRINLIIPSGLVL